MRITLFDLETSGHHLKYALPLIKFLNGQGEEILLLTSEDIKQTEEFDTIRELIDIQYISKKKNRNKLATYLDKFKAIKKAFKIAKKWNTDIFHFLYFDFFEIPLFCYDLISFINYEFRIVTTLHWLHFLGKEYGEQRKGMKRLFDYLNILSLKYLIKNKRIDNLFLHTKSLSNTLNKKLKLDRDNNVINAIPYPIDTFEINISKVEARKKLNLPCNVPILLAFGGLRYDKGIDLLLEALHGIDRDFKLVIAGKEEDFTEKDIDNMISKFNLKNKVIKRLEFIADEEVGLYFISCDAVVLPYRNIFKGQSGPLLQACHARKTVIAFNSGELGNIISDNNIGLVAYTGDIKDLNFKIKYFLNNINEVCAQYEINLMKYSNLNTSRNMTNIMYSFYKELSKV